MRVARSSHRPIPSCELPMRRARYFVVLLVVLQMVVSERAFAAGGLLGIDHEWAYDNGGVWNRKYQLGLEYGVLATETAGALWLGNDDPLGHEFWQSIDSTATSAVAAQLLKYALSRASPSQNRRSNQRVQGR